MSSDNYKRLHYTLSIYICPVIIRNDYIIHRVYICRVTATNDYIIHRVYVK